MLPGNRVMSGESLQPSASFGLSSSWARRLAAQNTQAPHIRLLEIKLLMIPSPNEIYGTTSAREVHALRATYTLKNFLAGRLVRRVALVPSLEVACVWQAVLQK